MSSFGRAIERLESQPISVSKWFLTFFSIVFVRNILEAVSSPRADGRLIDPISFFFHYPLFYLGALFAIALVLAAITREPLERVLKLGVFGLVVLWVAPIVDLTVTAGQGWTTAYLFSGPAGLLKAFATFFGPFLAQGITLGIRLGVAIGLVGTFAYVLLKTRRFSRAFVGALLTYIVIFLFFVAPSLLAFASGSVGWSDGFQPILDAFRKATFASGHGSAFDVQFSATMAQAYLVLASLLSLVVYANIRWQEFRAFIRNGRWLRVLHFLVLAGLGVEVAALTRTPFDVTLPNVIALGTLLVAIVGSWLSAVAANDLADERLDRLGNPNRPLASGAISASQMRHIAWGTAAVGLLAAALLGWSTLLAVFAFQLFYFVYSVPPLRLKRAFILGNAFVSLAQVSVFCAGFFALAGEVNLSAIPSKVLLALLGAFLLGVPLKDLKDIAGDRAERIPTIPARMSDRAGRAVVSILVVLASVVVAAAFNHPGLWIASAVGAVVVPVLIHRKPFREGPILVSGILYFILLGLILATRAPLAS